MKTTLQLLTLAVLSLAFSSCCGLLPCSGSLSAEREVTDFRETQRTVYSSKSSHTVTDRVPVTRTEKVSTCCKRCGSSYCPKPQCCGIVSKKVLTRSSPVPPPRAELASLTSA